MRYLLVFCMAMGIQPGFGMDTAVVSNQSLGELKAEIIGVMQNNQWPAPSVIRNFGGQLLVEVEVSYADIALHPGILTQRENALAEKIGEFKQNLMQGSNTSVVMMMMERELFSDYLDNYFVVESPSTPEITAYRNFRFEEEYAVLDAMYLATQIAQTQKKTDELLTLWQVAKTSGISLESSFGENARLDMRRLLWFCQKYGQPEGAAVALGATLETSSMGRSGYRTPEPTDSAERSSNAISSDSRSIPGHTPKGSLDPDLFGIGLMSDQQSTSSDDPRAESTDL